MQQAEEAAAEAEAERLGRLRVERERGVVELPAVSIALRKEFLEVLRSSVG